MSEQTTRGKIEKIDAEKRLVFGWAYVAKIGDDQVTDHSGDFVVDVAKDLEDAVYDYVLHSREGDEMHTEQVTSRLVESIVLSPEKYAQLGIEKSDGLLQGWWVGFKVENDDVWKKVQNGELGMFSFQGKGTRETVDA